MTKIWIPRIAIIQEFMWPSEIYVINNVKVSTDAEVYGINVICTCQETEVWLAVPRKGTHKIKLKEKKKTEKSKKGKT